MMTQAQSPPAELLLQLGLPDNLVIGLIIDPDLILRLPVAGGKQGNNLVPAEPSPGARSVVGVTDMLSDGVAMRSHDRILSGTRTKSSVLLICYQDQSRTTMSRIKTTA